MPYRKTLITSERMGPKPASARIVLTAGKDRQTGHNRFRLVLNPAKEVPRAGFDFPMLQYLIEVTAYFLGVCMKRCICYSRVSAVLTDEGFVVECPKCGRTTIPFQNLNQAVEEWNREKNILDVCVGQGNSVQELIEASKQGNWELRNNPKEEV